MLSGWQQATIGDANQNNVWVSNGNRGVTANGLILHFEIIYFVISNELSRGVGFLYGAKRNLGEVKRETMLAVVSFTNCMWGGLGV